MATSSPSVSDVSSAHCAMTRYLSRRIRCELASFRSEASAIYIYIYTYGKCYLIMFHNRDIFYGTGVPAKKTAFHNRD